MNRKNYPQRKNKLADDFYRFCLPIMKKLLLIALASLSLSIGASFAADMSASISPSIHQGVS